jgi:GT2 family glycosyltransferase
MMRETFDAVGGFDPDFFLYGEEESLCARVRALGGSAVYEPRARVRHEGGTSTTKAQAFSLFHKFRSRAVTLRKVHGAVRGRLAVAMIGLALAVAWLRALLGGSLFRARSGMDQAYFRTAYAGLIAGSRARLTHPDLYWLLSSQQRSD